MYTTHASRAKTSCARGTARTTVVVKLIPWCPSSPGSILQALRVKTAGSARCRLSVSTCLYLRTSFPDLQGIRMPGTGYEEVRRDSR